MLKIFKVPLTNSNFNDTCEWTLKWHRCWNIFALQMFRCYKRKVCYPTWKRWVFLLIPGTLIAGAGLIIFTFFETESNYKYTHSAWHACISISIVFLLPPRKTDRTGKNYSLIVMQESRRAIDELSSVDSFPGLASRAQLTPAQSPYGSPPQSYEDDDVPLLRGETNAPLTIYNDSDDVPLIIWFNQCL